MAKGYWSPSGSWVEIDGRETPLQRRAREAREELRRRSEEKLKERRRAALLRQAAADKRVRESRAVAASSTVQPLPQHDKPSYKPEQDRLSRTERRVEYQLKRAPRGRVRQPRALDEVERGYAAEYENATPKELLEKFGFREAARIRKWVLQKKVEDEAAWKEDLKKAGLKQEARPAPPRPSLLDDALGLAKMMLPDLQAGKGMTVSGLPVPKIVDRVGEVWGKSLYGLATDPVRVGLEQGIELGLGVTRGLGQLAAGGPSGIGGVAKQVFEGMREHYRQAYGEDPVIRGNELSNILDMFAVVNVAGAAAGVGRRVASGMKVRDAMRAYRHPELEGRFRVVESPSWKDPAVLAYGQSFNIRSAQKAFDWFTNKVVPERMPLIGNNTRVARFHGRRGAQYTMGLRNGVLDEIAAISDGSFSTWTDDLMTGFFGEAPRVTPQGLRVAFEYELPYKYRAAATGDNSGLERLYEYYTKRRAVYEEGLRSPDELMRKNARIAVEAFDAKLAEIREALQVDVFDPRVQNAIEAMDSLNAKNVEIKVKNAAQGDLAREQKIRGMFDQRSRLVGREVFFDDDAPGGYLPHYRDPRDMGGPSGKSARGQTVFDAGNWQWGRNEFAAFSQAKQASDPRLLINDYQRTSAIAGMDQNRRLLWRSGQPIKLDDLASLRDPENWVLVRKRGTMPPEEAGYTNLDQIQEGLARYYMETVVPANAPDEVLASLGWKVNVGTDSHPVYVPAEIPDVRKVRKKDADKLLRYYSGRSAKTFDVLDTAAMVGWDTAMNWTRATLLYTNPGYYVANVAGNMVLKFAGRGLMSVEDVIRTANMMQNNPWLYRQLAAEAGEGFTQSPLRRSKMPQTTSARRRFDQIANVPLRKLGEKAGEIVDAPLRVSQMVYELRDAGYKTWDEMEALFRSTDEAATETRAVISQRMKSKMVDFEQMEPWERNVLTRALLVYPWQRGITKYVLNYAATYTERTLLAALWAQSVNDEWERRMGNVDVPIWLLPYWPTGEAAEGDPNKVRMVGLGSISPADSVVGIAQTAATILGWEKFPEFGVDRPIDYLQPLLQDIWQTWRSKNEFDQDVPLGQAFFENVSGSVVPFLQRGRDIARGGSKVYTDRSPLAQALRSTVRFVPRGIDLAAAEESARQAGTAKKPREVYLAEKYARDNRLELLPPALRSRMETAYRNKALYETRRDELAKKQGKDTSARDRALLLGELLGVPSDTLNRIAASYAAATGGDLSDPDSSTWGSIADRLREEFYDAELLGRWESKLRKAGGKK